MGDFSDWGYKQEAKAIMLAEAKAARDLRVLGQKRVDAHTPERKAVLAAITFPGASTALKPLSLVRVLAGNAHLERLSKPLDGVVSDTANPLNTYLKSLSELQHYAVSPAEKKKMQEAVDDFKVLSQKVQSLAEVLNTRPIGKTLEDTTKSMQKNIKTTAKALEAFDKFSLEGKANTKDEQSKERTLGNRFCYALASFVRAVLNIFTNIFTLGQLGNRNLVAEGLGYGRFFITKPRTPEETAEINTRTTDVTNLVKVVNKIESDLKGLSEEINSPVVDKASAAQPVSAG
ncbi:MAG: hypothetical protein K0U37_05665 [Gammaproteobacteria bacterium]|nr:hypothetical protein [Gammaproteobacteria bacterium]